MAEGKFNENTRVQVPAALHLVRLGYTYLAGIKDDDFNADTNILKKVFLRSIKRINPELSESDTQTVLTDIVRILGNDDLGREFYAKLSSISGIKLIDFANPANNEWHVTTEFTCEDKESGDNFRPDITCFVNGLPLAFIEVKKPNNAEGILAEKDRIETRMKNKRFRRFINITQLMVFSNNQEYDHERIVPIQGAFYATTSRDKVFFNVFREADPELHVSVIRNGNDKVTEEDERIVLTHRNCLPIKGSPEYITNLAYNTPTNRILTSLLSKKRFLYLLRYGIAYVDRQIELASGEKVTRLEKHVMRYQQLFAALAIREKLEAGIKSGIIWHTQGSGKTALAFYNVRNLTDFYAQKKTAVKFYFIVDRLDLLEQASNEFAMRGLYVRKANSREELMADFRSNTVVGNADGKPEIMVVNIQKFEEDHRKVDIPDTYNINLIRVFFIDEAHRGYNPKGSFLANLLDADRDSVKIALTGTPLLKEERASWKVFGDYIDKYYYDKSIADGYTLRLMREDIETEYKEQIENILDELTHDVQVKKSDIDHNKVIESKNYLNALLDYIVHDIRKFRIQQDAPKVAGMIVCETNPQARAMLALFNERFSPENLKPGEKPMRAELILHDEGDKETRKILIDEFKKQESIDFLIVNNMLLTGFDAARLKKLYLCRKLDGHNLLQALTRVNRPYQKFQFGYIVDFANIKQNFIETNNEYLRELNRTTDDIPDLDVPQPVGDTLMISNDEIITAMNEVHDMLWSYDTDNAEEFRKQLDTIHDRQTLYEIRRGLENAKAMSNQVRSFGDDELKAKFETLAIDALPVLLSEVNHRIDRINLLENTDHTAEVSGIINEAISALEFNFRLKGKEELEIVYNDLIDRYYDVKREFDACFDKQEDKYVSLAEDFKAYFKKKGFTRDDVASVKADLGYMDEVMLKIREINRRNNMLKKKYADDEKFVRVHKRILEENEQRAKSTPPKKPLISANERIIAEELSKVKSAIDALIYLNVNVLANESSFNQQVLAAVSKKMYDLGIESTLDDRKYIRNHIANEYLNLYNELGMRAGA